MSKNLQCLRRIIFRARSYGFCAEQWAQNPVQLCLNVKTPQKSAVSPRSSAFSQQKVLSSPSMKPHRFHFLPFFAALLFLLVVVFPHHHHAEGGTCFALEWCEKDGSFLDEHTSHGGETVPCHHHAVWKIQPTAQRQSFTPAPTPLPPFCLVGESVHVPLPILLYVSAPREWQTPSSLSTPLGAPSSRRGPPVGKCLS